MHGLLKVALIPALAIALSACDTLTRRGETPPSSTQRRGNFPAPPAPTPGPTISTQPSVPTSATPVPIVPIPTPPPLPPTPSRDQARVGVIFGPGGMKTFAHLGVLREMNRARIPVHAIVGLEWGAVIGGLYAVQGQINDAEWKAFKLRETDLPDEEGFLSSRLKPRSIGTLQEFLSGAFGNATIEKARIDFSCPSANAKGDRASLQTRGSFRDAMSRCVPYPPLYQDNSGTFASPFSVEEAAAQLRAKGANVILLINVLGQGEILPSKLASEQATDNLLWGEIRREMLRAKPPSVQHVINVNTSGHPLTDFAGRRALMDAGQKAATDVVNKMVSTYGF